MHSVGEVCYPQLPCIWLLLVLYGRPAYIFATEARIDSEKKLVKQQYVLQMSPQYGELQPTSD